MHRAPLDRPWIAIGVLCVSGVIEALALRARIRIIDPAHRARGLLHWFRESGRPAVMLAVGEDVASVIGVLMSLAGVGATMITNNPLYDALGGIGVGIVLMGTATFSMRESSRCWSVNRRIVMCVKRWTRSSGRVPKCAAW